MLKIKDNVDLKELEKYGATFYYDTNTGKIKEIWLVNDKYKGGSFWCNLKFKKNEIKEGLFFRKKGIFYILDYVDNHNFYNKIDVLYDLIKDGLVEKVGD